MDIQAVNTEAVQETASTLRSVNESIEGKCRQAEAKAKGLSGSWHSAGGNAALNTIDRIFKMAEPRYQVLNNYITVLEQIVNPNYLAAEETNRSLASNFK